MNFTKAEYNRMADERRWAFQQIAKKLGEKHQITVMMGARAWGRHDDEQGVDRNLQTAAREVGALDGAFHILNIWARDNDRDAQRLMLAIYPRGFAPHTRPKDEDLPWPFNYGKGRRTPY